MTMRLDTFETLWDFSSLLKCDIFNNFQTLLYSVFTRILSVNRNIFHKALVLKSAKTNLLCGRDKCFKGTFENGMHSMYIL